MNIYLDKFSKMEAQELLIPQLSQLNDQQKKYLITRGGQQNQWFPFKAQTYSSSNLVFKLDPPSPSTVMDRNLILEVDFTMVINAKPGAGMRYLRPDHYGLRAYPFSSVTDTLTVIINGQSVTTQLSNIVHMLSRYNNTSESRSTFSSMFPNTLDMNQTYGHGAANNVLNGYDSTLPGCYNTRGSYPLTITGNVAAVAAEEIPITISGKIFEYVNISPFYQRYQEGTGGLSNIQNLTMNFTMSNLARMMSIFGQGTAESANTTINAATIYAGFITPPVTMSIPRSLNYSYNSYSYYSAQGTAKVGVAPTNPAGAFPSAHITGPLIQFSQLPEKLYIAVRKRRHDTMDTPQNMVSSTDTYLSIQKININFSNQDGIHSSTHPTALYLQSVRNGCNMSYTEWSGKTTTLNDAATQHRGTAGSVVALELGKDLALQGLDSVAQSGSWNFQITVDADNVSTEEIFPELAVIAVFDGIMTIESPGQCFVTLGIVTPQMVLQASQNPSDEDYDDVMRLHGGSFGSNLRRFFKSNAPMLRNVGKAVGNIVAPELTQQLSGIVQQGENIIRAAQQDANALTQAQGAALSGGMRAGMRAGIKAGNLHGGQVIPKSTLRSRAR